MTRDGGERRRSRRQAVDRDVTVEIGASPVAARLIEYSEGGASMTIAAPVEISPGDRIRLVLDETSARFSACVERVAHPGVAISFDREAVAKIIAGWLQPHIDRASIFAAAPQK